MDPERKCTINGRKVAEFYWAGEYPVYVDNRLVSGRYEEVCSRLEQDTKASPAPKESQS